MWRILAILRDVKALIKESFFCQINLDFLVYKTTNYVIIINYCEIKDTMEHECRFMYRVW